jgi:hypothetical protein
MKIIIATPEHFSYVALILKEEPQEWFNDSSLVMK